MSWFSKLFNEGKNDLESALNHVEAEVEALKASLEARIAALEGHAPVAIVPVAPAPESAPEPALPAATAE